MPRLLSVNVGLPRDVTWNGKTVRTSVWKSPVDRCRMVRTLDIDGDAQADLAGHGGENRAVFVYPMDSYHYWESFLGRSDFTFGQFGDNFIVEGLPDNEVSIGDRYRIGGAEFEVTQPRVTCYRVGIGMNEPRMPALLVAHHRPGFYFRGLQEGEVGAGDEIVKIADGPEKMSVADVGRPPVFARMGTFSATLRFLSLYQLELPLLQFSTEHGQMLGVAIACGRFLAVFHTVHLLSISYRKLVIFGGTD